MKRKMIFALLLAGGLSGMVNSASAQAFCGTNCPSGALSCNGDSCSAESGVSVTCTKNGTPKTYKCPKTVAPA